MWASDIMTFGGVALCAIYFLFALAFSNIYNNVVKQTESAIDKC